MPEGHRRARASASDPVEGRAGQRRHRDLGPDHVEAHPADFGRDAKAHADDRRAEEFRHDGADQRQRRVDLERIEDEGHGGRQPQLDERLSSSRRHRSASGRAPARPAAARPATVFTSIGKKVMITTTAALDCQSKPNHMTMIGAMPTIGRAETRLPSGRSPRRRNGTRSADDRDDEARPAADRPARQHRACRKVWTKSARSIGSDAGEAGRDGGGRRQQHARARRSRRTTTSHRKSSDERRTATRHREVAQRGAPAMRGSSAGARAASAPSHGGEPEHARRATQKTGAAPAPATSGTVHAARAECRRTPSERERRQGDGSAARRGAHGRAPMRRGRRCARRAPTSRDQHGGEERGREQRRPDLDGLAVIGAGEQPRAEAGLRAGRQFADDGADEAMAIATLRLANRNGTEAGQRSFQKVCARAGLIGAHQVELHRVGRGQALHHADRRPGRSTDRSR